MATVHPYKGYLNTQFHLFATGTEEVSYDVFDLNSDQRTAVSSGTFLPNIPHSLKLNEAGSFILKFSDGSSSEITVEDGFKFGGGKQKAAFIFDNTPWGFLVMHDRTYFFNRDTDESYVEPISPDSIEELSDEYVIFSNNNHSEKTIYSLDEQRPILNVSNIIYYNSAVIVWEEDEELVIYSLSKRDQISRFIPLQYVFDNEKKHLIYASSKKILRMELYGNFDTSDLYDWEGDFITLINSSICASSHSENNTTHIRLVNFKSGDTVKELVFTGTIASINDHEIIDTYARNNAIRNFDLTKSEFPEAIIVAQYIDIHFYPCDWDIFYVERTTSVKKDLRHFNSDETILLKSVNTNLSQAFHHFSNTSIITDTRFVIYNERESFIRSKYYSAAGYKDSGHIYVHNGTIVLSEEKNLYSLSRNGYWDGRIEGDFDFTKFEKYGIVLNRETDQYRSLRYNIKGKNISYSSYPEEHIIIGDSIIFAGGKVLFDKSNFYTFTKRPLGISPSFHLGIEIRDNKVFLLSIEDKEEYRREILCEKFDSSNYQQVLFCDTATKILYRNGDKAEVQDITTGEKMTFDNLSYVEQCNGIRPSFQQSSSLQPRIVNPITGLILDCDLMKKYKFISPDGRYYAGTSKDMYEEQYYRETDQIIGNEQFQSIVKILTYPSNDKKDSREWKDVTARRITFVQEHFQYINKEYPKLTRGVKDISKWHKQLIDDDDELSAIQFVRRVIGVRGIAIIRRMSDFSEVAKINLGLPLSYINYVSFSYDSRYVSLGGYRDFSHGLFLIYDIEAQKLLCRQDTNRAVWTTAFSCNQAIAAYTSNPFTIYIENQPDGLIDDDEFNNHIIRGRNFLTFSPDGKLMALSNQGYKSKYDINGNVNLNWGHQPSTFVEIRESSMEGDSIVTFNDLSECGIADTVKPKSVASVSFSNDNKRLMMVGNDGIVVIRNLHL